MNQLEVGTFVTVGNAKQPFLRLFKLVEITLDILPKPVIAQTGSLLIKIDGIKSYELLSSVEFKRLIMNASVLIMHAGAGSLIHALSNQQKPIVIPRRFQYCEHIDDHQLQLAREFFKQDRIFLVEDEVTMRNAIFSLKDHVNKKKLQEKKLLVDKIHNLLQDFNFNNHL